MKNTVSEMRNILDEMNSELDIDEEKSTKVEDTDIVKKRKQKENKISRMKRHL